MDATPHIIRPGEKPVSLHIAISADEWCRIMEGVEKGRNNALVEEIMIVIKPGRIGVAGACEAPPLQGSD